MQPSKKILMNKKVENKFKDLVGLILLVIFLPILIPWLIFYIISIVVLHIAVWLFWCIRGKNVLFVYSNSPNWQEYIEQNIIPKLPQDSVILNWSERKKWRRFSLPVMAFHFVAGGREFNPIAIVFRPFRLSKTFRFWQPFKDFKHGNQKPLHKLEDELFKTLGPFA